MKVRVKWIEGDQFMGATASGHAVVMEASASESSIGPSPLEMLLLGMGACASSDVVSILQKMRQNVDDVTVVMEQCPPHFHQNSCCIYGHWQGRIPCEGRRSGRIIGQKILLRIPDVGKVSQHNLRNDSRGSRLNDFSHITVFNQIPNDQSA